MSKEKTRTILVTKSSGAHVPFSLEKLANSLSRSGADADTVNWILKEIQSQVFHGITTDRIYKMAFALLRKSSRSMAARYKLKKAIMELGPSGYPFEKFMGEILSRQGYKTQVSKILKGKCVSHEIDVVAEKENTFYLIECKFHNSPGKQTDVKVPLYIRSRFLDVVEKWQQLPGHENKNHEAWVVTNTRFSLDAIQYARCAGLHLLGWDYPKKDNLKRMIDESGLHPITCLTSLTKSEKQKLLMNSVVLCQEILGDPELLLYADIRSRKKAAVMEEVKSLCS